MGGQPDKFDVHPGDVIQVTASRHSLVGVTMIVQEVRLRGVGAHISLDPGVERYVRLNNDEFAIIGPAAVLTPELLSARRASINTAAALAAEAGKPL